MLLYYVTNIPLGLIFDFDELGLDGVWLGVNIFAFRLIVPDKKIC